MVHITGIHVEDVRFPTSKDLTGSDAIHTDPDYSAAYVTINTREPNLNGFGIAFNVNDDFSVSYGQYKSRKAYVEGSAAYIGEEDRVAEVTSWQAAYTIGGASIRVADVKAENALFSSANDQTATIVSLGLAF